MSFNYNHITLAGRVIETPELSKKGATKATFRMEIKRPHRNESVDYESDFVPVVMWGRLAESVVTYLNKGAPVMIDGRLQVRRGEQNESKWVTEIVADHFQILDGGYSGHKEGIN